MTFITEFSIIELVIWRDRKYCDKGNFMLHEDHVKMAVRFYLFLPSEDRASQAGLEGGGKDRHEEQDLHAALKRC